MFGSSYETPLDQKPIIWFFFSFFFFFGFLGMPRSDKSPLGQTYLSLKNLNY